MVDELETDAAELLTSLTKSLTEGPASLVGAYLASYIQNKDNPEALKQLNDFARLFISKIPDLTRILSDSTKVLETYLAYKTAKREEEATNSLIELNKNLVSLNRKLVWVTGILAGATGATAILAFLTALRFFIP